jgi:competence protein ComEC
MSEGYNDFAKKARLITATLLLAVSLFLSFSAFTQPYFRISFLDVGQGDSILIAAPNGNTVLIDGGKPGSILNPLARALPLFSKDIDVVIATHPDADHIGGLVDVLNRYMIHSFIEPGSKSDSGVYKELTSAIDAGNLPHFYARQGMTIDMGEGALVKILFPDRDASGLETNISSVITRVLYGSSSAILTGDSPQAIEREMVRTFGSELASDVLKLGHHGSRTSSDGSFVWAVHPAYAIVSAGLNNSYGHPHKETVDLISGLQIPILETSKEGTIQCESTGGHFTCN